MKQASICVFCGSRTGDHADYMLAATRFGASFAENNWRLVYGAGDIGLMGAVARAAQDSGAETFGVIPTHLLKKEVGKRDLTNFIVTENMHERKKVMFMNSDAVVILPGGAGTMDEFFEVLTWRQLGLHDKPIFVLNTQGYWDGLLDLLDNVTKGGFADQSLLTYFKVEKDAEALEASLKEALAK
ncbi:MAG: TIGR00730 family Rossman fold protein [Paracoccaceae bacterium]|nr:TIGR00730 family Rossman fold protein [Paracoccaceae bacterium]MDG2258305.1 TIGR00730 family Rossman fold protein [Paracoccaceae bacterium]